jgi:hypothetical protein
MLGIVEAQMRLFDGWEATQSVLAPLREEGFVTVMTIYPTDVAALDRVDDLLAATGMTARDAVAIISPEEAAADLVRHILLESWLEVGEDVEALYGYCEQFFRGDLAEVMARAYLMRLLPASAVTEAFAPILLNNPRVAYLFDRLSVEHDEPSVAAEDDAVAWEFFRQILRPYLDPIDSERVERILELRASRAEEVRRLRLKCEWLVDEIRDAPALEELPQTVDRFIRLHVADEIAALMQLDRRARETFLNELLLDEKVWGSSLTAISAWATGHMAVSVGAAITALSMAGPKALRTARERRETLKASDYALVYRAGSR